MRLVSIRFVEFEGTEQEWRLENLEVCQSNLIVGKNASGKSRALNIISALAKNLSGVKPPGLSANYDVLFDFDGKEIRYQLKYENNNVVFEELSIDSETWMDRGQNGEGTIFAEEIDGGKEIRFQTPTSEFAAVARRDSIQHKFLEPLFIWASSLRHYQFGTPLGKDVYIVFKESSRRYFDESDPNIVVAIYKKAKEEFGPNFDIALINDMKKLEYNIEDLGIKSQVSIRFADSQTGPHGLYVKEMDLLGITDQNSMSQGMFRALSLLIHINYGLLTKKSTCLLIDDIGEGLDFDRSCKLIDLLRAKAKDTEIQLIMSTNDRFVMNRVPLEEWSVLQRNGNVVKVLNYHNSKELFDEFKFTGLSNFSFLELDYPNNPSSEEALANE